LQFIVNNLIMDAFIAFFGSVFILFCIIQTISTIVYTMINIRQHQNPERDIESLEFENDMLRLNIIRLENIIKHKAD
jgi:hypothetical protein